MLNFRQSILLVIALATSCQVSFAQYGYPASSVMDLANANYAFGVQADQQLAQMQQQLYQQYNQFWQSCLENPEFKAGYQQHLKEGGQLPYEQYVYWAVTTANGTNVQGAIDAQNARFRGWQQAAATQQSGFDSYNQGWWQNQARQEAALQRYVDQAVRGNSYYRDPYSGTTYTLPATSGSGYFQTGGETFYLDPAGKYYRFNGSNWTELNGVGR